MLTSEKHITCPHCGEVDRHTILSSNTIDDMQVLTHKCDTCGYEWNTTYLLVYMGYNTDTDYYDRDGVRIS